MGHGKRLWRASQVRTTRGRKACGRKRWIIAYIASRSTRKSQSAARNPASHSIGSMVVARLFLEQAAVTLNPGGRIISRRLRRQRETEKLGQITLRRADSRKLPVVGAKAQRAARQAAEHNIPGIEIVVN